jgi:hypothetical protein
MVLSFVLLFLRQNVRAVDVLIRFSFDSIVRHSHQTQVAHGLDPVDNLHGAAVDVPHDLQMERKQKPLEG